MAILIDPPRWPAHGRLWSHLVSDTSLEELHDFARQAAIPARGFEGDHYDVPEERFDAAVAAGALAVDGRTLLRALLASGLRRPKRRSERVLSSLQEPSWLPPGSRADVVASGQDDPPPHTVLVRLAVLREDSVLVLERPGRGLDLPFRVLDGASVDLVLGELQRSALGSPLPGAALVGYVRNIVPTPTADYGWPSPRACFAVYRLDLAAADVTRAGRWLSHDQATRSLADRHWWPLFAHGFGPYAGR